ncbi:MAG: hypothetical protein ACP5N0_13725 [Methanosarcina sp.]
MKQVERVIENTYSNCLLLWGIMAEFFIGNNASQLPLRIYTQLSGDEIQEGVIIYFADPETVSLKFLPHLLNMIHIMDVMMINQSDNEKQYLKPLRERFVKKLSNK